MEFEAAQKLGACLSRDYAEGLFRLLVNYRDLSASEAASRLGIHIRTAQDFLDTLAGLGILEKEEASERKRPYFRYRLAQREIRLDIDLGSLFGRTDGGDRLGRKIREKKNSGVRFATARSGEQIASLSAWEGKGRHRKERRISLTTPQGRFLYHLPFPTAEAKALKQIMEKAAVGMECRGEILDLVDVLEELGVIESC